MDYNPNMTTVLTKDISLEYITYDEVEGTLNLKAGEEFYFWKNSETEISWGEYQEFVATVDADFWNAIEPI